MKNQNNTEKIKKQNFEDTFKLIKDSNIAEEGSIGFTAAVMIFIGYDYGWDLDEIHKATGFSYNDVSFILENFYKNEIIVDGKIQMEIHDNELSNIIEISLMTLVGTGEVIRYEEKLKEIKPINMTTKKTLNDHLFDTLERLSNADSDNIETEMNKANSVIAVSEQILNVARLKLQIIQSDINISSEFTEIDKVDNTKEPTTEHEEIEPGNKKKLLE